ncbi:MAG: XdhC family protein [Pseudomonadota bacterium]
MTRFDVLDIATALRDAGEPFCMATVVRTADLTSAKAGAKAVVTMAGEIRGHLGGACVQRAVRSAAETVMASGDARMISIGPESARGAEAIDVDLHPSGCPSGGTVDVFLEPFRVPQRLWICGDTPIARAIEAHARLMGLDVNRTPAASPGPASRTDFAIVAAQGNGDADALRSALATGADYIAMIASHRKADVLRARLAADGVDEASLSAIHSPAGLDIGAIDPHDIAIAVLAELIAVRRGRGRPGGTASPNL